MVNIAKTRAYHNSFFVRSEAGASPAAICLFVREWFPVTRTFCLSLPGYTALFVKEILGCSEGRRNVLEQAMLVPVAIGAGEFGIGTHGIRGIHYKMFARLGEPFGLGLEDLHGHPRGALAETGRLVDGIQEALSDLYLGAGCIRVVEGTAYNIVQAMNKLFRPLKRPDSTPLYNEYQLEYITLHLELEKEHDSMAAHFVEAVCDTAERKARVEDGIERMCELFGDFWERIALEVFSRSRG